MMQPPLGLNSKNPKNALTPTEVGYGGDLAVSPGGLDSVLNITAATLVKATPGRLAQISVLVVGTTVGSANDAATVAGAATANQIGVIPEAVTTSPLVFNWPCTAGIVVTPGTGQTLAVSFS
jgi:hypothetical protein